MKTNYIDYDELNKEYELVSNLITALKNFSKNPEAIENLNSYLDRHFDIWCHKWANTPDGFINELKQFSEIE